MKIEIAGIIRLGYDVGGKRLDYDDYVFHDLRARLYRTIPTFEKGRIKWDLKQDKTVFYERDRGYLVIWGTLKNIGEDAGCTVVSLEDELASIANWLNKAFKRDTMAGGRPDPYIYQHAIDIEVYRKNKNLTRLHKRYRVILEDGRFVLDEVI